MLVDTRTSSLHPLANVLSTWLRPLKPPRRVNRCHTADQTLGHMFSLLCRDKLPSVTLLNIHAIGACACVCRGGPSPSLSCVLPQISRDKDDLILFSGESLPPTAEREPPCQQQPQTVRGGE